MNGFSSPGGFLASFRGGRAEKCNNVTFNMHLYLYVVRFVLVSVVSHVHNLCHTLDNVWLPPLCYRTGRVPRIIQEYTGLLCNSRCDPGLSVIILFIIYKLQGMGQKLPLLTLE